MSVVKEKITLSELVLLKSLNFEINFAPPNDYIIVYTTILYPDNEEDVLRYALKICSDSFFTYVNNLFKNYIVAIACIMLAAKFLSLPSINDKNFKNLDNMKALHLPPAEEAEFNERLLKFVNRTANFENNSNNESYYDILEWNKKIHPYMNIDELAECVKMLIDFYEDVNAKITNNINKK
jgi:hypothetical protein